MKFNIFSKLKREKVQPVTACPVARADDDTVITNFTESYIEAYFDGELETAEERQLEGVLGHQYIQAEMLKRGELRNIINRQSVLSVPSAHDLKQEKKRVWNEIEHELILHLKSQSNTTSLKAKVNYKVNWQKALLKSFSVGFACAMIGLVYVNYDTAGVDFESYSKNDFQNESSEYVLNQPPVFKEMVSMSSSGGAYKVKEKESVNARELKLENQEELSNLGAFIVRNQDVVQDTSMLTFVSNQGRYE